jgi:hypothetical protein
MTTTLNDVPGHPNPVSLRIGWRKADDLSPNESASLLRVHATPHEFLLIFYALDRYGLSPLLVGSDNCQPQFGCRHVYLLVPGYVSPDELTSVLTFADDLVGADTVPYPIELTDNH